jgi:hypothetical protein
MRWGFFLKTDRSTNHSRLIYGNTVLLRLRRGFMTHKHHHKAETVRLTIDIPERQHTYIKMLAAGEGVSLRQFVIERLPGVQKKKKHKDASDKKFNKLLEEFLDEKAPMLKRLAKK